MSGIYPRFGLPGFWCAECQPVLCLLNPSAVEFQHRQEKRTQGRQVYLGNLVRDFLEVKPRTVADQVAHRRDYVLVTELSCPVVEPMSQRLPWNPRRLNK